MRMPGFTAEVSRRPRVVPATPECYHECDRICHGDQGCLHGCYERCGTTTRRVARRAVHGAACGGRHAPRALARY